jgi:putative salt-induced outer membrane protein YdiY
VVVQLKNKSRIRGILLEETGDAYRLRSPELGELVILKAEVEAVLPADAPLGPPPAAEVAPPPPGLFGTQVLAGWEKSVEAGFSGKSSTTDSLDLYGKLSGDYSDEERRWRVRAAYFYGLTESEKTKNEGFANARRDWLGFQDPWFLFAEARSDYNEFKDYRFRAGGFVGVGYNFVKREKLDVIGRVGAGASYEFGEVDDLVPEALLALEVRWQVAENQRLDFINTLFPDLNDVGEYRNFTEASYTINLQRGRGLSLKVGVQNEYDSFTEDASDHNSLTYFGAMVYGF